MTWVSSENLHPVEDSTTENGGILSSATSASTLHLPVSDKKINNIQDVEASSSTKHSTTDLPEVLSTDEKIDSPPDGGLPAWLVVLGAWCGLFCSLGWLNSKLIPIPPLSIFHGLNLLYRYRHIPKLL